MKLKDEFISHNAKDESVLVPVGGSKFAGLVRGNRTLGVILDLLQRDTDEESVVAAMQTRFDAPAEAIAADVKHAISELRRIGALDE